MIDVGFGVGALGLVAAAATWLRSRRVRRRLEARSEAGAAVLAALAEGSPISRIDGAEEDPDLARSHAAALSVQTRIHELDYRHQVGVALFSSMSEAVVAVDVEHRVLELNVAAARLFGLSDLDATGRRLIDVVRNPKLGALVVKSLQSDEPTRDEFEVRSEGHERHLQVTGSQIRGPDGSVLGAIIVLSDVSRLRRLESVRRDFVANVSHELRTPMTSLSASLDALADSGGDDDERSALVAMARRQVSRLQAIVEDLLALSRLEAHDEAETVPLEARPADVLIDEAIAETQAFATSRSVRIERDVAEGLALCVWPGLGVRALANLVDNAIKFSPEGGVVRIAARTDGQDVVISVTDSGPGISSTHLPRIFERFYMVDRARSRRLGGTGLGLSIVRHVMNAHGGSVEVKSVIGSGSTFYLRFPQIERDLTQP